MKRRVLSLVQQSWYQLTLSYQKQAGKLFRQGGTNINWLFCMKCKMIFPLNTFVHSYRQPRKVPHLIHCAMLMIFKFYIQIHNYTITPSYRLRFVNGTNSRLRLVIRLVLIYVKRESTTTLAYHLLITSQARDLAKFIMPDLELNVAPCVITCFRKIL